MLEIAREKIPDKKLELIYLKGNLDSQTAPDFDRFFQSFSNKGAIFFILEASRLSNVANDGITSLFRLAQNIQAVGGNFVILHPKDELFMLFSFLGLTDKVAVCNKIEEAFHYFKKEDIDEIINEEIPEVIAEVVLDEEQIEKQNYEKQKYEMPTPKLNKNYIKRKDHVNCPHCFLELNLPTNGPYMCPGCGHQFIV